MRVGPYSFGDILRANNCDIHIDKQPTATINNDEKLQQLLFDYTKHYFKVDVNQKCNQKILFFILHEYYVKMYIQNNSIDVLKVNGRTYPVTEDFFKVDTDLTDFNRNTCLACG
jgi:hypothetical protein